MAIAQPGPPMPDWEAGTTQGCKLILMCEGILHHDLIADLRTFQRAAVTAGKMSSPPKEKADTRAGHLPAVKAGGMRIVQKHPHATEVKEEKEKDEEDWETGASPPKPTLFISGALARGDKDFPPAAAQVAHQKPHPSVEKLPPPQQFNQHIHQPRK